MASQLRRFLSMQACERSHLGARPAQQAAPPKVRVCCLARTGMTEHRTAPSTPEPQVDPPTDSHETGSQVAMSNGSILPDLDGQDPGFRPAARNDAACCRRRRGHYDP